MLELRWGVLLGAALIVRVDLAGARTVRILRGTGVERLAHRMPEGNQRISILSQGAEPSFAPTLRASRYLLPLSYTPK